MGYAKVTLMSFCNNRVKLQKKRLITNGPARKRHHLTRLFHLKLAQTLKKVVIL